MNTNGQWNLKLGKFPALFFQILSWNSASWPPLSFHHLALQVHLLGPLLPSIILFYKFVEAFDSLKIPGHCFDTQDTVKKVICLNILQALFSPVMPFSHESEHTSS